MRPRVQHATFYTWLKFKIYGWCNSNSAGKILNIGLDTPHSWGGLRLASLMSCPLDIVVSAYRNYTCSLWSHFAVEFDASNRRACLGTRRQNIVTTDEYVMSKMRSSGQPWTYVVAALAALATRGLLLFLSFLGIGIEYDDQIKLGKGAGFALLFFI